MRPARRLACATPSLRLAGERCCKVLCSVASANAAWAWASKGGNMRLAAWALFCWAALTPWLQTHAYVFFSHTPAPPALLPDADVASPLDPRLTP